VVLVVRVLAVAAVAAVSTFTASIQLLEIPLMTSPWEQVDVQKKQTANRIALVRMVARHWFRLEALSLQAPAAVPVVVEMAVPAYRRSVLTVRVAAVAVELLVLPALGIALLAGSVLGVANSSEASLVLVLRMSLMAETVYGVLITEVSGMVAVAVAAAEPSQAAATEGEACSALAHRVCSHFWVGVLNRMVRWSEHTAAVAVERICRPTISDRGSRPSGTVRWSLTLWVIRWVWITDAPVEDVAVARYTQHITD
jgi:hypothetical protein